MKKWKDRPQEGELVVIEIEEVNPHSVFASLEEYPKLRGMIHISEISRSWVRDIKKHVKEGEKDVAQVLGDKNEKDDSIINISLKRVNDKQKREKFAEWNKEKKADKFLSKVAEEMGEDREQLYEKIAYPFQKEFGTTFDGFDKALSNKEAVAELIDDDYLDAVVKVAKNNINLKKVKMEGTLEVIFPGSNAIEDIKQSLKTGDKVKISYDSAPKYTLEVWERNRKLCKKKIKETVQEIEGKVKDRGGRFSFERK